MKKWWLALALLLTLCCGAATAEVSGDWEYFPLGDGTVELCTYYGSAEDLVVPTEINGYKVSMLGNGCFGDNAFLRRVTIPDEITEIGYNPFVRCPILTEIVVSQDHPTLATIDGVLFYKPAKMLVTYPYAFTAQEYAIPQGIAVIGPYAFSNCELTGITIPDSVTTLQDGAFYDCGGLDRIVLPEGVTHIGESAFEQCTALREINIPAGVTAIHDGTFSDCISLPDVALPESVKSIGSYAFSGCWGFTEFTIPASVEELGADAFSNCQSLTRFVLPDTLERIHGNPFTACVNLADIVVSLDHPTLATIDGVLFEKAEKKLVCYPRALPATSYTIPQGIRSIGDNAFNSNHVLTEVVFPDSLTEIGYMAFTNCSKLTSVVLPDSVTRVASCAFWVCDSLQSITIPDSVTEIGEQAFEGCMQLTISTWRNAYAAQYAKELGIPYTYVDALDWLTN